MTKHLNLILILIFLSLESIDLNWHALQTIFTLYYYYKSIFTISSIQISQFDLKGKLQIYTINRQDIILWEIRSYFQRFTNLARLLGTLPQCVHVSGQIDTRNIINTGMSITLA